MRRPVSERAVEDFVRRNVERFAEAKGRGLRYPAAHLLVRIQGWIDSWPVAWGSTLRVWLYGSLEVAHDTHVRDYRLTVFSRNYADNPTGEHPLRADRVYRCDVEVDRRDVSGLFDALARLERFVGAWFLASTKGTAVGSAPAGVEIRYWCQFLTDGAATSSDFDDDLARMQSFADALGKLDPRAQEYINRALWWMRQSAATFMSGNYIPPLFGTYAAYWNALEALVAAICVERPLPGRSSDENAAFVQSYFAGLGRGPTPEDVIQCSRVIQPSFPTRARHAFAVVFGQQLGAQYSNECFSQKPAKCRLNQIRNLIQHASLSEVDVESRLLVARGLYRLETVVLRLFYCFLMPTVGHDPEVVTCHSCTHFSPPRVCKLELLPAERRSWQYSCEQHDHRWPP
jgi:hypothetical protein